MKEKKWYGLLLVVLAIGLMLYVEQVVRPGYWLKSLCKVILFLGSIFAYCRISGSSIRAVLNLQKPKKAKVLYLFMLVAYLGIVCLFFLLKNHIDLQGIKASLIEKENLSKENCLFVFAYIILCNSFLEEAFFRGFVCSLFEDRKLGIGISGIAFALYHIGIVSGWFNPLIYFVCIAGLAAVGFVLKLIDDYYQSLVAGWLIHGCANLAINTIGAILIFTM